MQYLTGEPIGANTAPDFVTGGDGRECAGIIVEARGIIQPGGFDDLVKLAAHAVWAVVEPPGRAEQEAGVVAGEGG